MNRYSPYLNPGKFELFVGPMCSGKTREMMNRIDKINYMEDCPYLVIKPRLDTRDDEVVSRFGNFSFKCMRADEKKPGELLELVNEKHKVVAIDEIQFFSEEIVRSIEKLLLGNKNVLASGLDLDFRGLPFGNMGYLMAIADEIYKLSAICTYSGCSNPATRTQRLINGEPACYDSPVVLVEGEGEEEYLPRCIKHHVVPGKP